MALRDGGHPEHDAVLQIAARHGASNVRLFGLVARGEKRPDSDIDLLIDRDTDRGCGNDLGQAEEPETLLHRHVDLPLARSLSPHVRPCIEAAAEPVRNQIGRTRPQPLLVAAPPPTA